MTFSLYTDDDYLPFLNLGDTSGISQIYIPSSLDGASSAISTPNFAFGSSNQSLAFVSKPHLVIDPMKLSDSGFLLIFVCFQSCFSSGYSKWFLFIWKKS